MAHRHPFRHRHYGRGGRRLRLDVAPQRQFIERLKKFDIDPEKGRVNEANLRRMYHSGGQAQKDAVTLICLSQKCSVDEAHAMFKKRPTRQEINQMAMQQSKGRKRPHR